MNLAQRFWRLPERLGREVFHFIFHPSLYLHSERAQSALPPHLKPLASLPPGAKASAAWCAQLPAVGEGDLEFDRVEHRMALLPPEGLRSLALWAGALGVSADLKRVVLREERESLTPLLPDSVWAWIHAQDSPAPWPPTPLPSLSALTEQLQSCGWACLEMLCEQLPASLGQRLRLKLPLLPQGTELTAPAASQDALKWLSRAYAPAVQAWDPSWEPQWQQALASGA